MSEPQSSTTTEQERAGYRRNRRVMLLARRGWISLVLVVATFAVFWPVSRCDFIIYDDPHYVTSNRHVCAGLTVEGITWAFRTGQTANWHPLTWLSHMLDVSLFGLNPAGHHLMNVLFHSANAVLLFALLRKLTGAQWRSAFVAALFALHPLHVESVAWISERKDVLSTFFALLSLRAYVGYARKQSRIDSQGSSVGGAVPVLDTRHSTLDYGLALLFFALGLMSKAMLVTLPFVMLLLDYWPLGRSAKCDVRSQRFESPLPTSRLALIISEFARVRSLILEKLPFFLLSAVFCMVTFCVQKSSGAVVALAKIPIVMRMENAFISYGRYLGKLCWPAGLALPYPYPAEWPWEWVLFGILLTLGLCATAWRLHRRWPFVSTGWFWFFGTLIPVIGLVQVGNQPLADRYTYVPSIGIFILVAWGGWAAVEAWIGKTSNSPQEVAEALVPQSGPSPGFSPIPQTRVAGWARVGSSWVCAIAALAVLIACGVRTRAQLGYWRDSETLFRHTVGVTKNNNLALDYLGVSLFNKGRLDEAMEYYGVALRINPKDPIARDGVGCCLFNKGQIEEAIQSFRQALQSNTNQPLTLFNLGSSLAQQQHYEESIQYFRAAMRLEPDDPDIPDSLGNVYLKQKRYTEAIDCYTAALRIAPDSAYTHKCLGAALIELGRLEEAGSQYQEALRLVPRDPEANLMLGRILARLGRRSEALVHLTEVLRLKPGDEAAKQALQELQN